MASRSEVPRIALSKAEAAQALGMSVDSLERYVLPDVKVIRQGRLVLVAIKELEGWAERNSAKTLGA